MNNVTAIDQMKNAIFLKDVAKVLYHIKIYDRTLLTVTINYYIIVYEILNWYDRKILDFMNTMIQFLYFICFYLFKYLELIRTFFGSREEFVVTSGVTHFVQIP